MPSRCPEAVLRVGYTFGYAVGYAVGYTVGYTFFRILSDTKSGFFDKIGVQIGIFTTKRGCSFIN